MPLRILCLSVLSVLVLSACAEMDDPRETEQVVSAVVVDEDTNQTFVIELAYTDAVTLEEAVQLVNNIDVVHDSGVSLVDEELPETILNSATGILYEQAELSNLTDHVFQVEVYSDMLDLSQIIQDYRWRWVARDIIAFSKHCPPGH